MNLANIERLTNYVCIFLLYVPNVEVGTDASKPYGKCLDPFSEGTNTYENANEHEIIISLIQLSESTSMPPNPGKSANSNEHSKNETEASSQKPSCKMPFIKPGILTKKEFDTRFSSHNNFIAFNDKPAAMSNLCELALLTNERKHAHTAKNGEGVGIIYSFLKHCIKRCL